MEAQPLRTTPEAEQIAPSAIAYSAEPKTALHLLTPEQVDDFWPVVEGPLKDALDRDGTYGPEHIYDWLKRGTMQLWIAGSAVKGVEGLALVELLQHPNDRVINFWLCTGQDRKRWLAHKDKIEAWAKEKGCTRSLIHARKGWAKELSDYKLTHVVLEKKL